MTDLNGRWVVDTGWLADHLHDPNLVVIDASWYLPAEGRDAHAEFLQARIPGAIFFDIDDISDTASPLPHMLPSPEVFAEKVGALGISGTMCLIVYDSAGMFSAARVWWTFRAMGADNVAVLDGGLPKWESEGRELEKGAPRARHPRQFSARPNPALLQDREGVLDIVHSGGAQIVDARSPARFEGSAPEPRPGLRSGRIPGAFNVPYSVLLNKDGTLKSPNQLRSIFQAASINPQQPVVTTCGSGVTASIVSLALALIGQPAAAVYDGSWSEWGADETLPIETGSAKRR